MARVLLCLFLLAMPATARAADRLTVLLDWFVNANHAALLSAQYSGAYARHGLDVRFIAPADPSAPPRLLAAHQADLCVSYQTELAPLDQAGLDLRRIATLEDTALNTLIVPDRGGIHGIADLKGRRIGVSSAASDEALIGAMLHSAGLTLADVVPTEINFQIEQALMSGRVDAVLGMRNYELLDLRQRGFPVHELRPEDHGVPPHDELILLARGDEAADPRLPRFLAALKEGTAALLADPEAMWRDFARDHPESDNALNHAAWSATLPVLPRDPARLDTARYMALQSFEQGQGLLRQVLPIERIAFPIQE